MAVDRRLCFVLPAVSGELKPSVTVDYTGNTETKRRDCGGQVLGLIGDLFRRLQDSKWASLNFCRDSVSQETKLFADMEGVQISGKIGSENPRIFGYSELYIGSNGFSDDQILGSGGFGRVYKAVLPSDGTTVAVKCLADKKGEHFEKTFAAELVAVAQLRHRNLVKLRGWCIHEDELLLVYDYMPNRSLDRVLFRRPEKSNSGFEPLDWDRRTRIVRGLAAALFYLHEQLETQIIHRDVKTSNVMLDSEFNARLGDFGLARWLEHGIESEPSYDWSSSMSSFRNHQFRVAESTRIGGTIGYLPPESFRQKTVATAKTDVFSFGVVVLEVISGRRAVDLTYPDDRIVLLDWVRRLSVDRKILNVGDSRLPEGSYSPSDIERLVHIALLCTLNNPQLRPNMKWVTGALSGEISGTFPALPSFKNHPRYIPLTSLTSSTPTTTTMTTTTTTNRTSTTSSNTSAESTSSTNYVTALEESIYHTAEQGQNGYFSNNSRRLESSKSFVVDTPKEIPFSDIVSATDDFSDARRVAEVDFGTAYYGLLNRDQHILVKRLGMTKCPALVTRFSTELVNLGRLRHRNLVQLRGWCTEHGEMLVVYDYSANHMLSHLLFHNRNPKNPVLRWRSRYNVIKSLACAIRYLHEEWDEQVVHRNITSSTIHLDRDMNPRLGGFALAEFMARNDQAHQAARKKKGSSVRGIFGYMAPEYMESGEAKTTADVYSFGVVILEMVTGQPAVDLRRRQEDVLLVLRIRDLVGTKKRQLEEVMDSRLREEHDRREMARLLRLGLVCTRTDPGLRPTMSQVMSILDGNDKFFAEQGREEGSVDRKQVYGSSMSMIRGMQALGIH
ncbi:PREDICTED: receptor like protein kinase S.2-like [Tarenaya hassleriana]|uniref:receptor like protein kinase S.2-like n=1 Tax=Tarenaya hassleriana TaxID=28532 RepID=UPI00053C601A|nr:PREDICTED: receptor like protein kinase S.2-like [Tarenaya hassleriana]